MVSIDTVYQKVLAFANKEQRGYITPQEFNLYADQAQKEIFEQYFYDLNQFIKVPSNSEEYSDIVHNINEKIAVFEETATSGARLIPGVYRLGTVFYNGIEIEEVQQNEILYLNQSYLTRPTNNRRVYVRVSSDLIEIHPPISDEELQYTYVRLPKKPRWAYFVVGGKALHDTNATATTNFELHASEETELVYKILKYAGLSMKRNDIAQGGQGLESLQTQQEKQ